MARTIPKGWQELEIKDFLKFYPRPVDKPKRQYRSLGIRSHCKGTFIREVENPDKVMMETLYEVKKNDLIVNITFAWEGAVALVKESDEGALVSHRFPTYVFDRNVAVPEFFRFFIPSKRFVYNLGIISPGGAGRNRVLDRNDFLHLQFIMPPVDEQKKIAEILSTWDQAIETLDKLIEAKTRLKKGLMQKLLTGKVRFKGFKGKWKTVEIREAVDYERPDKYVVDSVLEFDKNKIPVLTANKSFILGSTDDISGIYKNLPVIIFDDFTTDSKYVDFPFKVKSSAIKLLKPKNDNVNLRFIYESMKKFIFPRGKEHKRFFISEYQYFTIDIPDIDEQKKIASILFNVDCEVDCLANIQEKLKSQKQGLMQKLLTGKIRVSPAKGKVGAK